MGCTPFPPPVVTSFTVTGPSTFIVSGDGPYTANIYFIDATGNRHFIGQASPFLEVSIPGAYEAELSHICDANPEISLAPLVGGGGTASTITERPVCVISGMEVVRGFVVSEVTPAGTTVLRVENAQGRILTGDIVECGCECTAPVDQCVFLMGFDYYAQDSLDAGLSQNFEIMLNGLVLTTIPIDYLVATDGVNKSSWYADLVSYINTIPGFRMSLEADVPITADSDRPVWMIEYFGVATATLEIRKTDGLGQVSDLYTMIFSETGVVTDTLDEMNATPFGSEMFSQCENDAAIPDACIRMAAFDTFQQGNLDPGESQEFRIYLDGTLVSTVVHDYLSTTNNAGKSSWYTPVLAAIDAIPGWSTVFASDVPVDSGDKPMWDVHYVGSTPSVLTIAKGSPGFMGSADQYILSADGAGAVVGDTIDGTQNGNIPFGTDPFGECG